MLAAGDTGGANASAALISIGAAEEAAPAAEEASDSLPATGAESYLIAVIGLSIVAAGALVVRSGRDFARI